MRRAAAVAAAAATLFAVPACDDQEPVGLGVAGPLVTEYEQALERLPEIVEALGIAALPEGPVFEDTIFGPISPAAQRGVEGIGMAAGRIVAAVMAGEANAVDVNLALAESATRVRRHLARTFGASGDGDPMMLPPPDPIGVAIAETPENARLRAEELDGDLGDERSRAQNRIGLKSLQKGDFLGLAYIALLGHRPTRERLAPNLSPESVPEVTPELADELHLTVETRQEWVDAIFDDAGRLVIPTMYSGSRYDLLRNWADQVNLFLVVQVKGLLDVYLDGRQLTAP